MLVHGGTSGIGTMAIALGKLFGLTVIVTCGTRREMRRGARARRRRTRSTTRRRISSRRCKASPAARASRSCSTWSAAIMCRAILPCLAEDGRHVSIAVQRGATAEIPIFDIMRRRLTLTGSTLRPRSVEFKTMVADEIAQTVWPLCRGRAAEAGDRQHLPAGRGRRRARADGSGRPCRQDRAGSGLTWLEWAMTER